MEVRKPIDNNDVEVFSGKTWGQTQKEDGQPCAQCGRTDGAVYEMNDLHHARPLSTPADEVPKVHLHEGCTQAYFGRAHGQGAKPDGEQARQNGQGAGLPQREIDKQVAWYNEAAYADMQAGREIESAKLDAELRRRLAELVLPEHIETEFQRVMDGVYGKPGQMPPGM